MRGCIKFILRLRSKLYQLEIAFDKCKSRPDEAADRRAGDHVESRSNWTGPEPRVRLNLCEQSRSVEAPIAAA